MNFLEIAQFYKKMTAKLHIPISYAKLRILCKFQTTAQDLKISKFLLPPTTPILPLGVTLPTLPHFEDHCSKVSK